jgi:NADPH:quinone reductase-like Zn-dependent oxidoreductase
MKAIKFEQYGVPEVLHFTEIEKPQPKNNEILIRIDGTTVHIGDTRIRRSHFPLQYWFFAKMIFGFIKPRKNRQILGVEFAGQIEAMGKDVSHFQIGDQVFGTTSGTGSGAYAEYICIPEVLKSGVVGKKPINLSYPEAAAVPAGGMTAFGLLKRLNIHKGQSVLAYGASGSVGTWAVQLCSYFGAEVTAVCSTANFELVKSLGAKHTIDYTKEDFTKNQRKYDVIFDAVHKISRSSCQDSLNPNGIFLDVFTNVKESLEDLMVLKDLIEKGKIKPVIDRQYSWTQIVEAHRYVDLGHKRGHVIISVEHKENAI